MSEIYDEKEIATQLQNGQQSKRDRSTRKRKQCNTNRIKPTLRRKRARENGVSEFPSDWEALACSPYFQLNELKAILRSRGVEANTLGEWEITQESKLLAPTGEIYDNIFDAARSVYYSSRGQISREDLYYLASIRRHLVELELPYQNGPITVHALGSLDPETMCYKFKKLFPIGYETSVNIQVRKEEKSVYLRLRCRIEKNDIRNLPYFQVHVESKEECVFRSYTISKVWQKVAKFVKDASLSDLEKLADTELEYDEASTLCLENKEDGFGLLRRDISQIVEGLDRVLGCKNYKFWEERHPIKLSAYESTRLQLEKELCQAVEKGKLSTEAKRDIMCHRSLLQRQKLLDSQCEAQESDTNTDQEEDRRTTARKTQVEAREKALQDKKNRKLAQIQARKEANDRKEMRKEEVRREKEEEKLMKEEEKETRKYIREEEKRARKIKAKEESSKRRTDELFRKKQLKEEQKAILETGVQTNSSRLHPDATNHGEDSDSTSLNEKKTSSRSLRRKQIALLKFVEEEQAKRARHSQKQRLQAVNTRIWKRMQHIYKLQNHPISQSWEIQCPSVTIDRNVTSTSSQSFPDSAVSKCSELQNISPALRSSVLYIWDCLSTFADQLRLTRMPTLGLFTKMLLLSDDSSPVGDGCVDESSLAYQFFGFHALLLQHLMEEHYPTLQMGTSLSDFYRTRPLNIFTWPELARIICYLAIEKHYPSSDDSQLRALRGIKSYRDEAFSNTMKLELAERGRILHWQESNHGNDTESLQATSEETTSSSYSYYSVVCSIPFQEIVHIERQPNGLFLVKTVAVQAQNPRYEAQEWKDVQAGHYLLALNGYNVRNLSIEKVWSLSMDAKLPYGMLLTSATPESLLENSNIAMEQKELSKADKCAAILEVLRSKDMAAPFNQPVDAQLYPDYYTSGVIAEPMDLRTISEKLRDGEYTGVAEEAEDDQEFDVNAFVLDVNLVWSNCFLYNSYKAEISQMARKLEAIFKRLVRERVSEPNEGLIDEKRCRNCHIELYSEKILHCELCDAPYHIFCLRPALVALPKDEWHCSTCMQSHTFAENDMYRGFTEMQEPETGKELWNVIHHFSKENYTSLSIEDRIAILRLLCELMVRSDAMQSMYQALEESAEASQKETIQIYFRNGEFSSYHDLQQAWNEISPQHFKVLMTDSAVEEEITRYLRVDGEECELTDELLEYLREKAAAILKNSSLPVYPSPKVISPSSSDEEEISEDLAIIELYGDLYLEQAEIQENQASDGYLPLSDSCEYCLSKESVLQEKLVLCKRSNLTFMASEARISLTVPSILEPFLQQKIAWSDFIHMTVFADFSSLASKLLSDLRTGLYINGNMIGLQPFARKHTVYSVNESLLHRNMHANHVRSLLQMEDKTVSVAPVMVCTSLLPLNLIDASVSIVHIPFKASDIGIGLDTYRSLIYVDRISNDNFTYATISGQIFTGDVLYSVNDVLLYGKSLEEVQELMRKESAHGTFIILVREPNESMRRRAEKMRKETMEFVCNAFPSSFDPYRTCYRVTFGKGPLGLVLAMDSGGVYVQSMNDAPNGSLGQASASGQIAIGDRIRGINDTACGTIQSLSQFTSFLLSLPRPVTLQFSTKRSAGVSHSYTRIPSKAKSPIDCHKQIVVALKDATSEVLQDSIVRVRTYVLRPSLVRSWKTQLFLDRLVLLSMREEADVSFFETILDDEQDDAIENSGRVAVNDWIFAINGELMRPRYIKQLLSSLDTTSDTIAVHMASVWTSATIFYAHTSCLKTANIAWKHLQRLVHSLREAKRLDIFVCNYLVPRSVHLGCCRRKYSYFRFFSAPNQLFICTEEKEWFTCKLNSAFQNILAYLKQDEHDKRLAERLEEVFHVRRCALRTSRHGNLLDRCCSLSAMSFHSEHSRAWHLQTECKRSIRANGDGMDAFLNIHSRRYFVGTFHEEEAAKIAIQKALERLDNQGNHLEMVDSDLKIQNSSASSSPSYTLMAFTGAHIPSLPVLKAEVALKRALQRRYEVNGALCDSIHPISCAMYAKICRGLDGKKPIPTSAFLKSNAPLRIYSPIEKGDELRPLVDCSRALSNAWVSFESNANIQTASALAFVALSSFEQVKKIILTMVISDTQHPAVQRWRIAPKCSALCLKNFACLHHTYLTALLCAMGTQSLCKVWNEMQPAIPHVMARATACDTQLMHGLIDCLNVAITCCVERKLSVLLRARSLMSLLMLVRKTEATLLESDSLTELHSTGHPAEKMYSNSMVGFATFFTQLISSTEYLSGGKFDNVVACRPLRLDGLAALEKTSTWGPLPLSSFTQQIRIIETVRTVVEAEQGNSKELMTTSFAPQKLESQESNVTKDEWIYFDVHFEEGPLGIVVVNYSNRMNTILVNEFSNDANGRPGQAQNLGFIELEDQIFAVNGKTLGDKAMETFKDAVSNAPRPLKVTFRRLQRGSVMDSAISAGGGKSSGNLAKSISAVPLCLKEERMPDAACAVEISEVSKASVEGRDRVKLKGERGVKLEQAHQTCPTGEEDAQESASRRSSRVSRRIISTIADQYDPEKRKAGAKAVRIDEKSIESSALTNDGDVGELATDLLEPIQAMLPPLHDQTPASLSLLCAQLLAIEAALPRDAFRAGKWTRLIRIAWAEMVYTTTSARTLMQALLYLESSLEAECLDTCWKATPFQGTKHALASATIASVAMRVYALDEAITYTRQRRVGKRKNRQAEETTASKSKCQTLTQSKPTDEAVPLDELSFIAILDSNLVLIAQAIMQHQYLSEEKDCSTIDKSSTFMQLMSITNLSIFQIEKWYDQYKQLASQQIQAAEIEDNYALDSDASGDLRRGTCKKSNSSRSMRKRVLRGRKSTISVTMHCYNVALDRSAFHGFHTLILQDRLKLILDTLQRNELAWPFAEPVDPNIVPGYSDLIKHPMDLRTIRQRLEHGQYDTHMEVILDDMEQMWQNCFTYNYLHSDISKSAIRLRSIFARLCTQWITNAPRDLKVDQLLPEEACRICSESRAAEETILCDSCDGAYHLKCLKPPLKSIPRGNWFCSMCPFRVIEK